MSQIISKELLSEVLKKELEIHDSAFVEVTDVGISNNVVHINYKNTHGFIHLLIINIYELAHKCKEWAYNRYGICVYSTVVKPFKELQGWAEIKKSHSFGGDCSESEAIFRACQWILDNKEIK